MRNVFLGMAFIVAAILGQEASAGIEECRSLTDPMTRVLCYDAKVDEQAVSVDVTVSVPASSAPEQTQVAELQPTPPPSGETLFGRSGEDLKRSLEIEEPTSIIASVIGTRRNARGQLTIELDNQQVWQQADSHQLQLKSGEEIRIQVGMGGSYYLSKTSGSRSLKVRRSQ